MSETVCVTRLCLRTRGGARDPNVQRYGSDDALEKVLAGFDQSAHVCDMSVGKVFVGSRLAAVLCFMLTLGNCCAARDRRWKMHYVLAIRALILSPQLSTRSKWKFV